MIPGSRYVVGIRGDVYAEHRSGAGAMETGE